MCADLVSDIASHHLTHTCAQHHRPAHPGALSMRILGEFAMAEKLSLDLTRGMLNSAPHPSPRLTLSTFAPGFAGFKGASFIHQRRRGHPASDLHKRHDTP